MMLTNPYRFASGADSASSLTDFVAYYKLDETSGTRNDSSANAYHLTDNNTVTSAAGKVGNAASFASASSEYLSRSDPANMTHGSKVSWSFWAYMTTVANDKNIINKWTYPGDGEYSIQTRSATDGDGTGLGMYIATSAGDDGSGCRVKFASAFANATWSHIVIVFDGTQTGNANRLKAWANGTELTLGMGAGNVPATILNGTAPFLLCYFQNIGRYWNGLIDECGIWMRNLTAVEIAYLYNSGAGRTYNPATGLFE